MFSYCDCLARILLSNAGLSLILINSDNNTIPNTFTGRTRIPCIVLDR